MDNKELNKVKVDIFGETYTVRAKESVTHVKEVAALVDKKMQAVAKRNSRLSTSYVAVLSALNLADELIKLQEDYQNLVKLLEQDK